MLRGGSWLNNGRNARSAYRNANTPDNRNDNIGFRLARARDKAGWPGLTRRSSCPRCRGEKPVARGMSVGVAGLYRKLTACAWWQRLPELTFLLQNLPMPTLNVLPAEFPAPWVCDWGDDDAGLWMAFRYRGVRQQLRWIPPGEFLMGSPPNEAQRQNDETEHQVKLSQGVWLADTACTQALWQAVMGDNPSYFNGAERPVEQVSWNDIQDFLARLNAVVPDGGFRLPTEAEWEYACRAGADTKTVFSFGDQITPEQVNYDGNYPYAGGKKGIYRETTVDVKALPCNRWGLYQMHGNVLEWCQDWYGPYPEGTMTDPAGPDTGENRVLRGGSWLSHGRLARSASRIAFPPGDRHVNIGFRLARGQAGSKLEPEARAEGGASRAGQMERSGDGQARRDPPA